MTTRPLDQILSELSLLQRQFVLARVGVRTDQEAAKAICINSKTVYLWKREGAPIDEAIDVLSRDAVRAAGAIIEEAAAKAAAALVLEIDDKGKDRVRAAVEILNRAGLPETKRIEGDIAGLGILVVLDDPPDSQV
jgi:hypothetical protein